MDILEIMFSKFSRRIFFKTFLIVTHLLSSRHADFHWVLNRLGQLGVRNCVPTLGFWRVFPTLLKFLSQHKESVEGETDGRGDRPQMTHIRTWPRSYPDKHSDKVWKFSVESIPVIAAQIKSGRTDGWTDRSQMTHILIWPRSYPDKNFDQVWKFSVENYSSYRSTKRVWTCRRTYGQTGPRRPIFELDRDLT